MKRVLAFAVCLSLGCAPSARVATGYRINELKTARVGEVMIWWAERVRGFPVEYVKHELSYSGIDHGVAQVSYREFYIDSHGEFARSAFSNELKYDVRESKLIAFREFQMQVDSIDQQAITFRVTRGLAVPGMPGTGVVGIYVRGPIITGVAPKSPAAVAGIQTDDVIVSVNGEDVSGMDGATISGKIKGYPGTKVSIVVKRHGFEKTFDIIRP